MQQRQRQHPSSKSPNTTNNTKKKTKKKTRRKVAKVHDEKKEENNNNNTIICCLCLCVCAAAAGGRGRGGGGGRHWRFHNVHPMLRMIFKLYRMPVCDTCEHALCVKQRYFIASYRRRWLRRKKNGGRMTSYNIWEIDVDAYLWGGYSWSKENFYRYYPRDRTMELAVRLWRMTGQIIWDYEKLN